MQLTPMLFEKNIFRYILVICLFALLVAIGMYAYLGVFSRYRADDYCEAVRVNRSSPGDAVLDRYSLGATRASNRYSNLLFVGGSEMLGNHNMQITIIFMVLLWVTGLSLCVYEIRRFLNIDWFLSTDIFWGVTLGFFSFLQAPNLFQSVYWRSSMMTHFAPLVFGSFLIAFLVRQLSRLRTKPPSRLTYAIVCFAAFIVAGFSEPPTTTMVTILPLCMAAIWFWGEAPAKQKHLALLASAFAGAFLGLLTLALSPASVNIVQSRSLDFVAIVSKSLLYSYLFLLDSLKTTPFPVFISMLMPLLLIWLYKQTDMAPLSWGQITTVLIGILAIPVLMWLLIAAGFAPSVYGQGYPVERMRFLAQTIMIVAFMLEGALFGFLLKDLKFKYNQILGQWLVLALFSALTIIYPLRAAFNIYKFDMPVYLVHAENWDVRDAQIRLAVEQGVKDLMVVQLDSVVDGVIEYKGDERHWVNRCAAEYYGLNTLIAP